MNRWIRTLGSCVALLALLMLVLPVCLPAAAAQKDKTAKDKKPHDHPDFGPHGGALAEWGDDDFHAEFTIDVKTKEAVIYVLDDKAKNAPKIDVNKITDVKLFIPAQKIRIVLQHDAKRSGVNGIAYVGTNDAFTMIHPWKGTINGKVNGKPYSGDFQTKAPKEAPK
jgi:hypothetical protein